MKNQARKRYQEGWGSKEDFNFLTRLVGREIKKWRQHSWVGREDSSMQHQGRLYLGLYTMEANTTSLPLRRPTPRSTQTKTKLIIVLVKCFVEVHNISKFRGNKCFTEKVSSVVREMSTRKKGEPLLPSSPPSSLSRIKPTSPKELVEIINSKKKKIKAPVHDDIPNIVLKNLSLKAVVKLTNLINSMLSHSYFPTSWKKAKIFATP